MPIKELIQQGMKILENTNFEKAKTEFAGWSEAVKRMAASSQLPYETQRMLNVKMHFVENEYSQDDSMTALKHAAEDTIHILETIETANLNDFSEHTAHLVIERILNNFYLHIKAMYQENVHGKGTIKKSNLDELKIGNEYDVQRILYSLLVPIFPGVRTEVDGDNGYGGVRTDIYLNQYKTAIEIKCTRKNMTQKELVEQLGSDGFHYPVKTLFMFVYDKEGIVKNISAFEDSFKRNPENGGKKIRAIVIQPIRL